jgi:hypothetical protein
MKRCQKIRKLNIRTKQRIIQKKNKHQRAHDPTAYVNGLEGSTNDPPTCTWKLGRYDQSCPQFLYHILKAFCSADHFDGNKLLRTDKSLFVVVQNKKLDIRVRISRLWTHKLRSRILTHIQIETIILINCCTKLMRKI